MFKRVLLASCASGAIGLVATTAHAATASASAAAAATSSVTELVVTAEKREQSLQHVAIAITAFTAAKRDAIGINSIQDMTNFTPGLTYSTSTDRITLRGVGRTTNVLSADAPVANYDDGLYETFAVAAGRSSLELAQVDRRARSAGHAGRTQRARRLARRGHPAPDLDAAGRVPVDGRQLWAPDRGSARSPVRSTTPGSTASTGTGTTSRKAGSTTSSPGRRPRATTSTPGTSTRRSRRTSTTTSTCGRSSSRPDGPTPAAARATSPPAGPRSAIPTYEWGVAAYRAERRLRLRARLHRHRTSSISRRRAATIRPQLAVDRGRSDRPLGQPAGLLSINTQWTWHSDGFDIKYIGGGTYYHYELAVRPRATTRRSPATFTWRAASRLASCGRGGLVINPTRLVQLRGTERLLERRAQLHLDRQRPAAVGRWRLPVLPALPAAGERRGSGAAAAERPSRAARRLRPAHPVPARTTSSAGSTTGPTCRTSPTPAYGQVDWKFTHRGS